MIDQVLWVLHGGHRVSTSAAVRITHALCSFLAHLDYCSNTRLCVCVCISLSAQRFTPLEKPSTYSFSIFDTQPPLFTDLCTFVYCVHSLPGSVVERQMLESFSRMLPELRTPSFPQTPFLASAYTLSVYFMQPGWTNTTGTSSLDATLERATSAHSVVRLFVCSPLLLRTPPPPPDSGRDSGAPQDCKGSCFAFQFEPTCGARVRRSKQSTSTPDWCGSCTEARRGTLGWVGRRCGSSGTGDAIFKCRRRQ